MPQQVGLADVQDASVGALHQVDAGGERELPQDRAQVRVARPRGQAAQATGSAAGSRSARASSRSGGRPGAARSRCRAVAPDHDQDVLADAVAGRLQDDALAQLDAPIGPEVTREQVEVDRRQVGLHLALQGVHHRQPGPERPESPAAQLGAQRGQHPLLADRAREVARLGRDAGVAGPGVVEGLRRRRGDLPRREEPPSQIFAWNCCSDQRIAERDRVVDRHAAHQVDHLLEPGEVDRHPVLDLEAGDLREHVGRLASGLGRRRRARTRRRTPR